ncbi:MAG: pilus assembly protein PilM [Candidatus Vogelbacteria bacterium]|nr:pilus assembly protein PilM [Candidatus Vogelbacteria bacterium]
MARTIVTGIDVGTQTIRVVVAEFSSGDSSPRVLAMVERPSFGLKHGYITHHDDAVQCIRRAKAEAEQKSHRRIRNAFLSVGGETLTTLESSGSIAIARADGEITDLDLERVLLESEQNIKDNLNYRIIHSIPLAYKLDGKPLPARPRGLKGSVLEVSSVFVAALEQHLEDLISAVVGAGVQVNDCIAAPIAASIATLSKRQKAVGCLLADIGAETVSMTIFEDSLPIFMKIFPVGGSDITNDIALGFKISLEESNHLKHNPDNSSYLRAKIDDIMTARLVDIFELIQASLKKIDRSGLLPAGAVILGGSSRIAGIEEIARKVLNIPAQLAPPIVLKASSDSKRQKESPGRATADPVWATAYGLCLVGNDPDSVKMPGQRVFQDILDKLFGWSRQFLP